MRMSPRAISLKGKRGFQAAISELLPLSRIRPFRKSRLGKLKRKKSACFSDGTKGLANSASSILQKAALAKAPFLLFHMLSYNT